MMGNFADSEMLYCDEELELNLSDMDINDTIIDGMIVDVSIDEDDQTMDKLKPQHLMFDGLDEDPLFSFSNYIETYHKDKLKQDNKDGIANPFNSNDWCHESEDSDDWNNDSAFQCPTYISDECPSDVDCVRGDNWNYDKECPIGWEDDMEEMMKLYDIPTIEEVYDGPYYEESNHIWSLPERDEMDDMHQKMDQLRIDEML